MIREEADNFALWLTDRMSRAQFEECSFKLSMSEEGTRNTSFRLLWQDGTQHGKMETYFTSRVRIFPQTGDLSKPRIFDGEWSSLTPALTVDVKPEPPNEGKTLYVVVSGAGCVTIRDTIN
ncbi:MAG: hypothetical protein WC261_01205 [Synergistaceae bacterium]